MSTDAAFRHSLSPRRARNLATATKTFPQMRGITPRYLLRSLPWVDLEAGVYRVNRRRSFVVGDDRIETYVEDSVPHVVADDLREVPFLREVDDELLAQLARGFAHREAGAGEVLAAAGAPHEALHVLVRGRAEKRAAEPYGGTDRLLEVLGEGNYFDAFAWVRGEPLPYEVRAVTACTVLTLDRRLLHDLAERDSTLRDAFETFARSGGTPLLGVEYPVDLASGHAGEPNLPETYVDYDEPREYELSVAQTVLKVHTRVSDVYNSSIDQTHAQLRLTVEALRERQEREMLNNREFGLLHSVGAGQRVHPRNGAPTPDDLDELLTRVWKQPSFFLAHPKAIAAFGRECTRRGVPPAIVERFGSPFMSWRGVPLLPCDKLDLRGSGTSVPGTTNILLIRVGEVEQGVVGLRPAKVPDEIEPGLSVRPMAVDQKALTSYLVSSYFSVVPLVEDAIAVLQNVEVSQFHDYD